MRPPPPLSYDKFHWYGAAEPEPVELRSAWKWTERVREELVHAAAAAAAVDQHMRGSAERKRAWELYLGAK